MTIKQIHEMKGQTLVIVALSLFALIALVALAIDGGNLMAERRQMQNAADAGALAGARAICAMNADPEEQAYIYAGQNGAERALTQVNIEGQEVTVGANRSVNTYFAGLIGFRTVIVGAEATAVCGRAHSASGLWPVAFDISEWTALYDAGAGCGVEFLVWTSDKMDCAEFDCDLDDDGRNDIIAGGDRGWLDFGSSIPSPYVDDCVQPGCGAGELACQIRSDTGSFIELPTCIAGVSGVKGGVRNDVIGRIDDFVRIPLYEYIGCPVSGQCNPSEHQIDYWVTDFGCVKVVGYFKNYEVVDPSTGKSEKSDIIRVAIDCTGACVTSAGGTGGEPPSPWSVYAVSLVK